jgi:hypothetical protein
MKQTILKIVSEMKETLKSLNSEFSTSIIDELYESLNQIEDEIYTDDITDGFSDEDEDY